MPAATDHRSEGFESVSGVAPPMLKSGSSVERKREQVNERMRVCLMRGQNLARRDLGCIGPRVILEPSVVGRASSDLLGPRVPRTSLNPVLALTVRVPEVLVGLDLPTGIAYNAELVGLEVPMKRAVRNWTLVAELIGLMRLRRRATRVASVELDFECRAGGLQPQATVSSPFSVHDEDFVGRIGPLVGGLRLVLQSSTWLFELSGGLETRGFGSSE
ncbi:hypothetical protein F511_31184 [Dorcoceras hygrometricum]|uniref:Uncharacterized protein n=1 Tax=Dorcoceras hygrometricum TaxID=472368 RepID=A0A2Z7CH95_9LAMI|nr:hypothetical protein F511_31184 [Dorcoceras hygrometricum]